MGSRIGMEAFRDYLDQLFTIRSSRAGVNEISYYSAVNDLFNAVGKTLKPRVECILQLKNRGAGNPDGGFYTADQLGKTVALSEGSMPAQLPARGAIEIKGTGDDVLEIARTDQA